jgi:hypothetical protein
MLGFVGTCRAVSVGAIGVVTCLVLSALALAAYGFGLGAGYIGERATERRPTRAASSRDRDSPRERGRAQRGPLDSF